MPVFKLMFCWSLRSGTIGIGRLGLGLLAIGLTVAIAILRHNQKIAQGGKASYEEVFALDEVDLKFIFSAIVISIITHIMLILGATLNNRFFLIPWLFVTMIMAVSSFLIVITYGVIETDPGKDAAIYIFGLLFSVLYVYLWLGVLSFFQELQEIEMKDEDTVSTADCKLPPPYAALEAA